jgi:hypothetical protein
MSKGMRFTDGCKRDAVAQVVEERTILKTGKMVRREDIYHCLQASAVPRGDHGANW